MLVCFSIITTKMAYFLELKAPFSYHCTKIIVPELFVAVKQPQKESCPGPERSNYEDRFPDWNL